MKSIFFIFLLSFCTNVFAQKKLVPITQSTLTGITLPAGSKQDNGILMTSSAKMLMEMETKKANITVSNTEVLVLPAESLSGYNKEMIIKSLLETGWIVSENQGDKDYSWLQKGSQSLLMYFSSAKKEIALYFAVTSSTPSQNPQVTNTNNNQTTPVDNNNTQQPTDTTTTQTNSNEVIQQTNQNIPTPSPSGFTFTSTNFDDGWTSTIQEDWVEVTKGAIKVLLHYPKEGTIFPADPEPLTNAAWNILIAPRYSNLKNYKTSYVEDYKRPYFGMGYATENKTGNSVFIVLFRRGGGWIEIVATDNNSFTREFGFDPETIRWEAISEYMGGWVVNNSQGNTVKTDPEVFDKLENMAGRNKFAVAASDFKGKWTSDFTGIQQLYNVYTGSYAGMHINQSNEEFVFGQGNTYNWKLLVVNGMAGNAKFNEVKSSGKLSLPDNWHVHFSMIETRARTYHAFWSCIKAARILNLLDADSPGSGIYTKYGLAK